jgi:hypothetical protein
MSPPLADKGHVGQQETRVIAHAVGVDGAVYEFVIVDESWCGVRRDDQLLFVVRRARQTLRAVKIFDALLEGRPVRLPAPRERADEGSQRSTRRRRRR